MTAAARDQETADAFATSWNNLPAGSVYTEAQVVDWFAPIRPEDIKGKTALELGCGNGSLLFHVAHWDPAHLEGIDLGDSVLAARMNLPKDRFPHVEIRQGDILSYRSKGYDVVYCIGVLHHLKEPQAGFRTMVNNTKPGGRFHGWVYAHEGNGIIRWIVDPIRKVASKLPWWVNKYFVATPLVAPYFLYAHTISRLPRAVGKLLPLYEYSKWICKRDFLFFRHVAFDQLVTPQTVYISRSTLEQWLASDPRIDPDTTYIEFRNGNSWKFGGTVRD